MHNREITHIVKTDSLSKTQLSVRTKRAFCCHLRETCVKTKNILFFIKHNAKARIKTKDILELPPLYWMYWGYHGPINHGLSTPFLSYILSYSERSQNAGFHPRSHHLAIERPSPSVLRLVDKVVARFNCAIFNSHITGRKSFVTFVLPLERHVFFWVIIILHRRLHWRLVRLK